MAESPQYVPVEAKSNKVIRLGGPERPFAAPGRESKGNAVLLGSDESSLAAKLARAKAEALSKAQEAQAQARKERQNASTHVVRERTPKYKMLLRRLFGRK